ncbi:patatin-like phospholipase family protein [Methylobacterium sp. E-025]|uniref:patatin-like phospholipase family protein n=1 Tax=Methylobacterium sp. E-025 TaxID=2836561 RepID=UPI001FB98D87|nr:patatin-like phospholipase family protein [Methylobacterium sp. E-025]MCJ2113768.1 patatin-like phospholipase family protein [Methylobacterium sp. E-025]
MISRNKKLPLASYFDLIAGTSTGGIIAIGLCASDPRNAMVPACDASKLVELYKYKSSEIFGTIKDANMFANLIFPTKKYSSDPLEKILLDMLGDSKSQDALSNFLVTAYEIEQRTPKVFTNIRSDKLEKNYFMRDLARATSAAPTFFDPARIDKLHKRGEIQSLMDGGIFASNPSMVALMHTMRLGWDQETVHILSLGTGNEARPYFYHEVTQWNSFNWVSPSRGVPIVSMLMQSQSKVADEYLNLVMNKELTDISKKRYLRIDGHLLRGLGSDALDDTSPANLKELESFAGLLLSDANNQAVLNKFADMA